MPLAEALDYAEMAEDDLRESTHSVPTQPVLELVEETSHSAYDCEYVALAQELDVPLGTGDTTVADRFPDTAALLEDIRTRLIHPAYHHEGTQHSFIPEWLPFAFSIRLNGP